MTCEQQRRLAKDRAASRKGELWDEWAIDADIDLILKEIGDCGYQPRAQGSHLLHATPLTQPLRQAEW